MRHLVLALLIALLPLRSWMGDAMAVSMLATPAHASMASAMPGHDHTAMADSDAAHGSDHDNQGDHGGSGTSEHAHQGCEVCNGPAMALTTPAAAAPPAVHGTPAPMAERFASAPAHRGVKPPIS